MPGCAAPAAAGLSQIELAARMAARGLPWYGSTVSKTESGDRPPTLTELYALAEVLDVDMNALLNPHFDGAVLRTERAATEAAGARVTSLLEQVAQARAEQGQHLRAAEPLWQGAATGMAHQAGVGPPRDSAGWPPPRPAGPGRPGRHE